MLRFRKMFLLFAVATVATLVSTIVPGRVSATELGMVGCENECSFLTGGWPVPFIVDGPGVSPAGSVDLLGVLLSVDTLLPKAMAANLAIWFAALVAGTWAISLLRRRNPQLPMQ
ncbi:hypothetical protein LNV09_15580 [Paucibacter sp. B2R-40]|uniref:hypothetical protein n=1 Tax=unclassified Roseateles TaxID=2626991 RepID=UPI0021E3984D|nr:MULTISPECIES: hypothetical protein [unclassified Roseateles]MCV2355566.1 hypothetical protein [Paucibacter sp. B2R-40]MCV2360396.1 hypothetical protein [Paucibacter sp. TC2R-5]